MTYQEAIDGLAFTMDMITWRQGAEGAYNCDPSELNEDSRLTYDACKFAIQALEGLKEEREAKGAITSNPRQREYGMIRQATLRSIESHIEELSE